MLALRTATLADRDVLRDLIARSARQLSAADYRPEQVEGALQGAFGVDSQLIHDATYFVVEEDGVIVGCGGWSYRKTLFGGDERPERDVAELDPRASDPTRQALVIRWDPTRGVTVYATPCAAGGACHIEGRCYLCN